MATRNALPPNALIPSRQGESSVVAWVDRTFPGELDAGRYEDQSAGDDDSGASWRAIAGLFNPYEEGGADDYVSSLRHRLVGMSGPHSLASLVAETERGISEPGPARTRTRPPPLPTSEYEAMGGYAPVTFPAPPPLPRFPMAPNLENVLARASDSIAPTSSSIAPVAFAPDYRPLASPRPARIALRLVAGTALGALAATAVAFAFLWLPARENIVASSSHAAAGLAARPAIVPTYNLQPVNISAVALPMGDSEPVIVPAAASARASVLLR